MKLLICLIMLITSCAAREGELLLDVTEALRTPREATLAISLTGGSPPAVGGCVRIAEEFCLTAAHVVAVADRDGKPITLVSMDEGTTSPGEIVVVDPMLDLALVQIELPSLFRSTVRLGANPRAGQPVYAIGFPDGKTDMITSGIVSGKTNCPIGGRFGCYKIDAGIRPGNSGGGVFDRTGRLVGISQAVGMDYAVVAGVAGAVGLVTVQDFTDNIVIDLPAIRRFLSSTAMVD